MGETLKSDIQINLRWSFMVLFQKKWAFTVHQIDFTRPAGKIVRFNN